MRTLLVFLALTAVAYADPKADARARVTAADLAFKLGRFDDALADYAKAYELFPAPPLLFNLAQCHKNLKHWERAVFFFEGYLRERPDAPNRSLVEELIREARAELAAEREQERLRIEAEERRRDDEARQRALEARRVELEQQRLDEQRRQRAEHDKIYRKWWFWSAVGAVALTAGGTAYYFSGDTTTVLPSGSLGGLDRR